MCVGCGVGGGVGGCEGDGFWTLEETMIDDLLLEFEI